jgi:hypothetical protein
MTQNMNLVTDGLGESEANAGDLHVWPAKIPEEALTLAPRSYFVSYNKSDLAWAEWVAWIIEELGYRSIIQAWDFIPGSSWPAEMQQALSNSYAVVCILSPDFLGSDYATAEWQVAFASDPVGKKRRIIPVRVRDCDPQGFLQTRVYVDLVGKDRETARDLIRHALNGKRKKPAKEPSFPGLASAEPTFPGNRVLFALVLDGTFDEFDQVRVTTVAQHLQKLLKDASLTIVGVRAGSVILTVDGSSEAFRRLELLFREGSSVDLLGSPVRAYWKMRSSIQVDPIEDRLLSYESWLPQIYLPRVDKEAARDLVQEFILLVLESDELRAPILQNPALAAQVARGLLLEHLEEKRKDDVVRRKVASNAKQDGPERQDILALSRDIYSQLSPEERGMLEYYWNTRFHGGDVSEEELLAIQELEARVDGQFRTLFLDL